MKVFGPYRLFFKFVATYLGFNNIPRVFFGLYRSHSQFFPQPFIIDIFPLGHPFIDGHCVSPEMEILLSGQIRKGFVGGGVSAHGLFVCLFLFSSDKKGHGSASWFLLLNDYI